MDSEVSPFLVHPVKLTVADGVWPVTDTDSVLCTLEDRAKLEHMFLEDESVWITSLNMPVRQSAECGSSFLFSVI